MYFVKIIFSPDSTYAWHSIVMSPIRSMTLLCPIPYTVHARALNVGYAKVREYFPITEEAPTRAFSWVKAATTAFTFKTLLRHYAERALTPRSLNVKLGLCRKPIREKFSAPTYQTKYAS